MLLPQHVIIEMRHFLCPFHTVLERFIQKHLLALFILFPWQ